MDDKAPDRSPLPLHASDPPADYPEYGAGYYAVFFADPDGLKLERVHKPDGLDGVGVARALPAPRRGAIVPP